MKTTTNLKASQQISGVLDVYSKLQASISDMREAIDRVDLDSFYTSHEQMLDLLESLEMLRDSNLED